MTGNRVDLLYVVDRFPELTQTFVVDEIREVRARGLSAVVVALRPARSRMEGADDIAPTVVGSLSSRWALSVALGRSVLRRPMGTLRALAHVLRRSMPGGRDVLGRALQASTLVDRPVRRVHAHFAHLPARVGVLLAKILGVPFSFTAHGSDVFVFDVDLDRTVAAADVVITPCDYFRDHITSRSGGRGVSVPVGVDPELFRRTSPYPAQGFHVVAVGRLVEKKGFRYLIEAVASLSLRGLDVRATIVGEGPLNDELHAQVQRLHAPVVLVGPRPREEVRDILESASVVCLPCVVASNGDRDSQPVVLKEAMAMSVPVVATSEVGIPELVDQDVGRLVPPGDAVALAAALADLARMPPTDRRAMGERGRRRVQAEFALAVTIPRLLTVLGLADPMQEHVSDGWPPRA